MPLSQPYTPLPRSTYTKRVYVDREFQKKTNELVQRYIDTDRIQQILQLVEINSETNKLIKENQGSDTTTVINLVTSLEKIAGESSDDPYLIGMAERA